ncbi:hypothetical protein, partial [Acidovorax sp. SUPP1855]|uniref:hypothetical protein n=1 Tax=Acidovorax sp. SUPP1855 TaxID=431774 RepID=UPI0024E058BC
YLIHHRQLKGQCVVLLRSLNPLIHLTFLSDEQKGVNLIQDGSKPKKKSAQTERSFFIATNPSRSAVVFVFRGRLYPSSSSLRLYRYK